MAGLGFSLLEICIEMLRTSKLYYKNQKINSYLNLIELIAQGNIIKEFI